MIIFIFAFKIYTNNIDLNEPKNHRKKNHYTQQLMMTFPLKKEKENPTSHNAKVGKNMYMIKNKSLICFVFQKDNISNSSHSGKISTNELFFVITCQIYLNLNSVIFLNQYLQNLRNLCKLTHYTQNMRKLNLCIDSRKSKFSIKTCL